MVAVDPSTTMPLPRLRRSVFSCAMSVVPGSSLKMPSNKLSSMVLPVSTAVRASVNNPVHCHYWRVLVLTGQLAVGPQSWDLGYP